MATLTTALFFADEFDMHSRSLTACSLTALFLSLALLSTGCEGETQRICAAYTDVDCDGVPDDLGRAVRTSNGDWAQIDLDGDGVSDGLAVDSNGDGVADAALLDTDGDGLGDALDFDGDGIADLMSSGEPTAPVGPGNPTAPSPPGSGGAAATGGGANQGTGGNPFDFGDPPDISLGAWKAPIIEDAQEMLALEYVRWKNANLKACPTDNSILAVEAEFTAAQVVSEGIGYGMLIVAGLGTQDEFDGLWNYYKVSGKSPTGLMSWECYDLCGNCSGNEASDADLDVAMALLQAEHRWGGGAYQAAAVDVIRLIRTTVLKACAGYTHLVAGAWDPNCELLNPSYFSPGYYRVFANVDVGGASWWTDAITGAYANWDASKGTGSVAPLWPDATDASANAKPGFANNGYDAARVPWRIATDYAWSGSADAAALLTWAQGRIDANGFHTYATDSNSAFWGANALTGLSGGDAKAQAYFDAWMNANMQDAPYYQGTLRVLYLMLFAGQFTSTFDELN